MKAQSHQDAAPLRRNGTTTTWALCEALTGSSPRRADCFILRIAARAGPCSRARGRDELLMPTAIGQRALCDICSSGSGTTRYYDPLVGGGIGELIGERTRAVFLESPGTNSFEVQDVPGICAAAKAKGLVTLLDNTWATPLYFPAIASGIDLSILACTKYIGGHADLMLGSVTVTQAYAERLERTRRVLGQSAGPDDAWLG